ncbi:MAG: hypothetical protein IBJ03_18345 [Gemmatimonadaceae bacterium]|nr:hypothetical protein [Gemmatimonadaceae bacterium]
MNVPPIFRSVWFRAVAGLLGVYALYDGIQDIRGTAVPQQQDNSAIAQNAVPGYGPPQQYQPSQYQPLQNQQPQYQQPQYQQPQSYGPQPSMPIAPSRQDAYQQNGPNNGQWYRDPQGRYELTVPAGWQASAQEGNLEVRNGNAYALLAPFDPRMTGDRIVAMMGDQYSRQWRGMRVVTQGQLMLSGAPGSYMLLRGQNPRGVESLLRIAAVSGGGQAWLFVMSAPMDEFNQVSPQLQQIEMSFAVGNGR